MQGRDSATHSVAIGRARQIFSGSPVSRARATTRVRGGAPHSWPPSAALVIPLCARAITAADVPPRNLPEPPFAVSQLPPPLRKHSAGGAPFLITQITSDVVGG